VYVASLRPGVGYWDTANSRRCRTFWHRASVGISGVRAHRLLWSHTVPFGDPAYRMNLLSAVGMSIAAARACRNPAGTCCGTGVRLPARHWFFAVTRVPWTNRHPMPTCTARSCRDWVQLLGRAAPGTEPARAGRCWSAQRGSTRLGNPCGNDSDRAWNRARGAWPSAYASPSRRVYRAGRVIVPAATAYLPLRSAVVYAQRRDPTLDLAYRPGGHFGMPDLRELGRFRAELGGANSARGTRCGG